MPYRDGVQETITSAFEFNNLLAFTHNALPPLEDLPDAFDASGPLLPEERSPFHDTFLSAARSPESDLEPAEHDVWRDPASLPPLKGQAGLLTWSTFANGPEKHDEHRNSSDTGFVTEAGPGAFDAAIAEQARASYGRLNAGRVIKNDAFLNSLFDLGLGRASSLFTFDHNKRCFLAAIENGRVTGTTVQLSQKIVEDFMNIGHTTRLLRSFVSSVYEREGACAGLVALASATRMILDAVEESCVAQRPQIASLLQLQQVYEQPKALLSMIHAIYDRVQVHELGSIDDEIVAWSAFESLQEYEASGLDVTIIQALFRRVSQPWLEQLERLIGLRHDTTHDFVAARNDDQDWRVQPTGKNVSRYMSTEDIKTINETHDCIAYMQRHHPDHPLSTPEKLNDDRYGFEWTQTWSDLDEVIAKAREYGDNIRSAIKTIGQSEHMAGPADTSKVLLDERVDAPHVDPWSVDFDMDVDLRSNSAGMFNEKAPDELRSVVDTYLTSSDMIQDHPHVLPTALIVQSSLQPMLNAQNALLSAATLDSVLRVHQLSHQLNTLHSFHLFSSGTFATSMSHVLFTPDIELTERRKGVARSGRRGAMGLALGSGQRREWPPTSSELSLALMGVLEDCGSDTAHLAATSSQTFSLPPAIGDQNHEQSHVKPAATTSSLSFALRTELDPKTIERVLDASTIYALDFLKLSYTPPAALKVILSDEVLEKYDRIFQSLLRLLRIQFVTSQLFADLCVASTKDSDQDHLKQKFRHRATQLLNTLLTYFQYTAIETPWRELMRYIASAEADCSSGRYTLATLRSTHESTLNRILGGLFLRRRQAKLAEMLENLLTDILNFTQVLRTPNTSQSTGAEASKTTSSIYERFSTHHSQFVAALEEAAQRAEMGKGMRGIDTKSSDADSREVIESFAGLAMLLR